MEKKKKAWNHRTNPPAPVPERLRTPDGREFSVEELLRQTNRDRQSHNLTTPTKNYNQTKPSARSRRYTPEARSWIAHNSDTDEIAFRLGIDRKEARRLQYRMRRYLHNQGLWDRPYC